MDICNTDTENIERINWASYRFELRANDTIAFPDYRAALWRSLFGVALRNTVCVTKMDDCQHCMLAESCAYTHLFETRPPPGSDRMRRYASIPHPFVIKNGPAQTCIAQGECFALDMQIFGHADRWLPYIIHALLRAGKMGLMRERKPFSLQRVLRRAVGFEWNEIWYKGSEQIKPIEPRQTSIPPSPPQGRIQLDLVTPFRFVQHKKVVGADNFGFHHLYRSLSRRISMLAYFHDQIDLALPHKQNIQLAERIRLLDKNLHWTQWSRYSSRQRKHISMAGITGSVTVDLGEYPQLWPVIWLGQYCHAGKGTTMGLGEYRVATPVQADKTGKLVNAANHAALLDDTAEPADRRKAAKQDRG